MFGGLFPGIGEARIVQNLAVSQRFEERDQVGSIVSAQCKAANQWILRGVMAAAGTIVLQDSVERSKAAVAHIRRSQRDVAQRRSFRLARIGKSIVVKLNLIGVTEVETAVTAKAGERLAEE